MAGLRSQPTSRRRPAARLAAALLMVAASTLRWAWPSRRAGEIRPSTFSTCRPSLLRRSSPGCGPALLAALASALAYNFFFTAPHMTFRDRQSQRHRDRRRAVRRCRRDQPARLLGPQAGAHSRKRTLTEMRPSPGSRGGCSPARASRRSLDVSTTGDCPHIRLQCRAGRAGAEAGCPGKRARPDAADSERSRRRGTRSAPASGPAAASIAPLPTRVAVPSDQVG